MTKLFGTTGTRENALANYKGFQRCELLMKTSKVVSAVAGAFFIATEDYAKNHLSGMAFSFGIVSLGAAIFFHYAQKGQKDGGEVIAQNLGLNKV